MLFSILINNHSKKLYSQFLTELILNTDRRFCISDEYYGREKNRRFSLN